MSNIHFIAASIPSQIKATSYYVMDGDKHIDTVNALEDSGCYYIEYGRVNQWLLVEPSTDSLILMQDDQVVKVYYLNRDSWWHARQIPKPITRVVVEHKGLYRVSYGNSYPYMVIKWFSRSVYGSGDLICYPETNPDQAEFIRNATFRDFQQVMLSVCNRYSQVCICHTTTDINEDSKIYIFGGNIGVI